MDNSIPFSDAEDWQSIPPNQVAGKHFLVKYLKDEDGLFWVFNDECECVIEFRGYACFWDDICPLGWVMSFIEWVSFDEDLNEGEYLVSVLSEFFSREEFWGTDDFDHNMKFGSMIYLTYTLVM